MNLYNLAKTGLNASQAGMEVTSHNINNQTTIGYNRQRVVTSTAGATGTGEGFFGRGVKVDTVQRQYDSFLYRQLVTSQGTGAGLTSHLDQLSQINDFLSDRTVGITPALNGFFTGLNNGASKPGDPAVRQDLLGKANSLATQLNLAYRELQNQRDGLNTQISTTVEQVNSYLNRINELNQQITIAEGKSGQPPNDLLDQRDQAVSELNQLVGIRWYNQNGSLTITMDNGQTLLSGTTVRPLKAVASAADPRRTVLAYEIPAGGGTTATIELADSEVSGGKLGGLLAFRNESLDPVQNQLGQLAIGLAMALNEQHEQGVDLNGDPGEPLFGFMQPSAITNRSNAGTGSLAVEYSDANELKASGYTVEFDGTDYRVTRMSDGETFTPVPDATGALTFDGLTVTPAGVPAAGDSWQIEGTRDAARDLTVLITDPAKLALADAAGGTANGNNGLAMAELQTKKVLGGGSMSLTEAYATLVNNVGVQAQALKSSSTAQDNLIKQQYGAQQAVSGVNLDEEYVNLQIYQTQYQASAKILEVAGTVFDTLLGLR
ncbi:flagellar hook-associated protein FlgK [Bordetella genomosp. 13]|uniref:Flagellar hook-associated protein 1 n=1 Tax=Bordetella genomosp. 13 TaxID=463040 RepID=A0A1W6ZAX0_9BORD|nr:flagellar hook-associated protein FlgK [Bordetella genomosp. 13]ARP94310.1 flagellar hook-associated protein FlgK [Bordetella genomosp. 13]